MLTPMPATSKRERSAMYERSVIAPVDAGRSGAGGHRRTAAGTVSLPQALVRTSMAAVSGFWGIRGLRVGTGMPKAPLNPASAGAR